MTATDSAGNIYAAMKETGKSGYVVQTSKLGPQGGRPLWTQSFNLGGLSVPAAIALDGAGNAYVAVNDLDVAATSLIKYDSNGILVSSQTLPYQGQAFMPLLSALALDPGGSRLYAVETFLGPNHGGLTSVLALAYDLNLAALKTQILSDGPGVGDEAGAVVVEASGRVALGVTQYRTGVSSVSYVIAEFSPGLGQLLSETASAGQPTLGMLGQLSQFPGYPEHGSRLTQLNDVVPQIHTADRSIASVLDGDNQLMNDPWQMGLDFGFIFTHDPARDLHAPMRIQIDMTSATVREVLDALTMADTNYAWVQDGNVIDFVPRHPEPKWADSATILEQTLPHFSVQNETMLEAVASLIEQSQTQGLQGLSGPKRPLASREVEGWFSDEEKISLTLTGKTVRQCLNAIVAADSPAEWFAWPRAKGVLVTALVKHTHHFYHRDLSAQEAADLKKKYPEPPPRALNAVNPGSSSSPKGGK